MRMFVPERDVTATGGESGLFLQLAGHSLGLPYVILARPGQPLLVADVDHRADCSCEAEVPHLFRVACALRQRLTIDDLLETPAYRGTTLGAGGPELRFFASVPLISPSGASLGALCAVDVRPRELDAAQLRQMEGGARVLATLLVAQSGSAAVARLGSDLARVEGAARALAATGERYRKMYERASALAKIGVWECDLVTGELTWTEGVYDIFGLPQGSPVTRELVLPLYDPASRRDMERLRRRAIETGTGFTLDVRVRDVHGTPKWVRLSAEVETEAGVPIRIFGLKQDITQERALLDRLRIHAECDSLTGLSNRAMFERALGAQGRARPCALLLVDLDGFKAVNDTFGHAAGDACLAEIASRLRRVFRGAELIARIGGDEFAVLIGGRNALAELESRAWAAISEIAAPIAVDGRILCVGASIGIARAGAAASGEGAGKDLFARADSAMYAAKNAGRNRVCAEARLPGRAGARHG